MPTSIRFWKCRTALLIAGLFLFFTAPVTSHIARAESPPNMTVWKSPYCGCCAHWVTHMRNNGFHVTVKDVEDLGRVKRREGISEHLQSCHTAKIGEYVIEGHVPAKDVKRLLKDRPKAHGLAVPGMPSGSPGMENGQIDRYDVLLLKRDGAPSVFSSHP
ncbi:MAG: DUF411 domain-containing protein [Rhodospirillales bacterium]